MSERVRIALLDRLGADLLGPDAPEEEITDLPSDRYLTGILFPQKARVPDEEQEQLEGAESDGEEAAESDAAGMFLAVRPASAGCSFAVEELAPGEAELQFEASCGIYEDIPPASGQSTRRWRRRPHVTTVVVKATDGEQWHPLPGVDGLVLYVRTARRGALRTVTSTLVNQRISGESRVDDEGRAFFQSRLEVRTVSGCRFAPRPSRRSATDADGRVAELIYRDAREFAVGHTCSVEWTTDSTGAVTSVATSWLPRATVHPISPEGDACFDVLRKDPRLRPLSAGWLAGATDEALVAGLGRVVSAWVGWLDVQESRIPSLPAELQLQARENVTQCRTGATRMKGSVDLLARDALARSAFRLAQQAIVVQRRWSRGDDDLRWRPFQLGFQLLALASVADSGHPDRAVMDLLWFPTGGGKTEAYLALTAFVLFLRRMRWPDESAGVAVLMRYTLRLLTIQQFQRASALVLACEHLRRGKERPSGAKGAALGAIPFSIGLWVGGGATPNSFEDAVMALEGQTGESTPQQLVDCPCCRRRLVWRADSRRRQVVVRCEWAGCAFASGSAELPVWTVDADVYEQQPSLVIATVDKFAQIARNGATARLFGLGDRPRRAPDLVIQDELHLISGPLGTLTGLYETAVDMLCARGSVRPKVIGSTATIRRAREQIRALFDRGTFQFPPPCIDAANSGFAVEDRAAPGRLYVGLSSVGRSPKFTLQAACASLLQSAATVSAPPEARDPYWTLVAYFNALRELGGAVVLMLDDVPESIRLFAARRGDEAPRRLVEPVELTSRIGSREIPRILADLGVACGPDAVDVLLASNMISVGVDIPRLGLMVVNGQPKTMAEYIQATSRVGRETPGLVLVVENHSRVRDRSNFESFPTWHSTIYREVEATSVTPFASRARDKALPALLVAMARHLVVGRMDDPTLRATARESLRPLIDEIVRRAKSVMPDEAAGVQAKLHAIVQRWVDRGDLEYFWNDRKDEESLMISAEQAAALDAEGCGTRAWPAPNSMREVEPGTPWVLKEGLRSTVFEGTETTDV